MCTTDQNVMFYYTPISIEQKYLKLIWMRENAFLRFITASEIESPITDLFNLMLIVLFIGLFSSPYFTYLNGEFTVYDGCELADRQT